MKINVSSDIYIRLLLPTDAISLFNLIQSNRNYLKQWLPWLDLVSNFEQTQTFIDTAIYRHNESESSNYAIFYQEKLVGLAGFNTFDFQNKNATLGYWLAELYVGKGIITQVVKTLLDMGFIDYKLHKIAIHCAVENLKSRAIPERLGFVCEGQFRQCEWLYDHYVDHMLYSTLKTEFFDRIQ
ncbi:GNAT family N-acetyltransferase [Paraglaciecola sp. L3A3]|uniref:GNAT family N-acetyltransferase n=1 Tax=Paraglaciecola sp. L3A3 TaxID=2686358 RepID=UPI00131DB133|nr:GNAT family protein [Paraglaciecola sp. L3A3]